MKKPKVYVTRIVADSGIDLLRNAAEVHVWEKKELMPRKVQLELFADCDGLLATTDIAINNELLTACPSLKVVSNHAVGYDNVDVAACTAEGVPVGNTPGVLSETTADLAFAGIASMNMPMNRNDRQG